MNLHLPKDQTCGAAKAGAVVQGAHYRITVLTPALLRFEYSESGLFEDRCTQHIINRDFPVPAFKTWRSGDCLYLETALLRLRYDEKTPSAYGLQVRILSSAMVWHYGDEGGAMDLSMNLGGTARTLDMADGAIDIGEGLMSRGGYAVFDDSDALLIGEDHWIERRSHEELDLYFFGYGHDYKQCLKDLYHLAGPTPLLPRFAMGNWWSKYHRYDEAEYKTLITRFEEEGLPFSVAVIDMDWHLVNIDKKWGTGWTGYTWNRELFPDPPAFLRWLHEHGLQTTLNVHPADGVRGFEEQYPAMARAMGIDPATEEEVEFDIADPHFLDAYFQCISHPHEKDGVDFWWIDWQQGTATRTEGLDPLWMLNHFYYLDNAGEGKRPLIFSRYAGIGSHRYPVGFSGDTLITWASLDFQPYFTIRAANVGYTWWSHDIGGHMMGVRDDELTARWLQLGTFSPILRLHSSDNDFNGKEPWKYNRESEAVMKEALRLRYRLVPYLYTMNYLTHTEARPIVTPLYFEEPEQPQAYSVRNEFWFGTQMLVCPITTPRDTVSMAGRFDAWLPAGDWYDFENGTRYTGGRMLPIFRGLEEWPVFVKAGGIIPMDHGEGYDPLLHNPSSLLLRIYPGADGSFRLVEDDGTKAEPAETDYAVTAYTWKWSEKAVFTIHPAQGDLSSIPEKRQYALAFYGIQDSALTVRMGEEVLSCTSHYDPEKHLLTVTLPACPVTACLTVTFDRSACAENDKLSLAFRALLRAQMSYDVKQALYNILKDYGTTPACLTPLHATEGVPQAVLDVLDEIILTDARLS